MSNCRYLLVLLLCIMLLPACFDSNENDESDGDADLIDGDRTEADNAENDPPVEDGDETQSDGDASETENEASPPDTWPAEEPGPYNAGAFLTEFEDNSRDRLLPGTVWYPTNAEDGDILRYQGWFPYGSAFAKVPVAEDGPFPLIVFSHGHQAFDAQSFFLTEYLAGHGYVVAACDHVEDTLGSYEQQYLAKSAMDRPQDVSLVIDTLLEWNGTEGHPLQGKIDTERIGVTGHSYGGNTAVASVGAHFDINRIQGICEDLGPEGWRGQWWICKDVMGTDFSYVESCADPCVFGDPRILASVPMTPGFPDAFSPEGVAEVEVPMLIMAGEIDDTVPLEGQVRKFFEWSDQPDSMLWILEDAGHMTFSNMCMVLNDPNLGCGEGFIDADRGWLLINTATVAFFGLHVKGDLEYSRYFDEQYLSTAPEITIERK